MTDKQNSPNPKVTAVPPYRDVDGLRSILFGKDGSTPSKPQEIIYGRYLLHDKIYILNRVAVK